MMRRLIVAAIAALLVLSGLPWLPAGPAAAEPKASGPGTVLVVMDTSGSMSASTDGGSTRIEEARSAVLKTADSLPTGARFGLIAYPGNGRVVDGCSIGDEEIKLGTLEAGTVSTAVRRLTPSGDTPTGPALQHAADVLRKEGGHGTIIVVSDGDANCGSSNLCEVAEKIAKEGMAVQAHTVGFHHEDDQLACVAKTLGGRHVNVTEPGALEPVLEELSGAKLEFDLEVPKEMPEVAGTGTQGSTIVAKVRSTGQQPANNVRVSIQVTGADGKPSTKLIIPQAVRFLGNLQPGQRERQVRMTIRPPEGTIGDYKVTGTAYSVNTSPVQQSGSFKVVRSGPVSGLLGDVQSVAVLGDSYSSGEGSGDYIAGTNSQFENMCHRSKANYAGVMFSDNAYTIACSGATTWDFWAQQQVAWSPPKNRGMYEMPQLKRLHEVASHHPVDAVFLSVGGNDVGFGDVLGACIAKFDHCIPQVREATKKAKAQSLADRLADVYTDVDNTINSDTPRKQRGQHTAPIVVVPYPRITPTNNALAEEGEPGQLRPGEGCMMGVSPDEITELNSMLDAVNATIARAVDAARATGVPVYYAQDVIGAFQPDHTICARDSYAVNSVAANAAPWLQQQIAHPNRKGYEAMASSLRGWSQTTTRFVPRDEHRSDWSDVVISERNPVDKVSNLISAPVKKFDLMEPLTDINVQSSGYQPNSVVTIEVRSTPRAIGSFIADRNGNVNVHFVLPSHVTPGRHKLVAQGIAPDGSARQTVQDIRVIPRYSGIMTVVFLVGVILAAGGAISIRRAKKRKSRASRTSLPT
ncbi:VWA domain-containing protein [Gordonia sp. PP30]|uniref:VWA domain-containing protein n=1 Tax=Gordonia sp. PP30 TaxID=2935861 RepID=UPI001FFECFE6|nr:VWA domain-containing protein [Gordonia sp. PP30]UQE73203.1 VWA domain-containing protein [Gordonia sp. PP30]